MALKRKLLKSDLEKGKALADVNKPMLNVYQKARALRGASVDKRLDMAHVFELMHRHKQDIPGSPPFFNVDSKLYILRTDACNSCPDKPSTSNQTNTFNTVKKIVDDWVGFMETNFDL